jgi:2-haloacid dehalogenase
LKSCASSQNPEHDKQAKQLQNIRAISFDCYGTLVDWEHGILAAFKKLLADTGVAVSDSELLEHFARHESKLEAQTPIIPYFEVLSRIAKRVGKDLNVSVSNQQAKLFAESIGTWPLFEDVLPALKKLQGNYTLAILSNVDRRCFKKTEKMLDGTIDLVCIAEETGAYKPSAAAFEALLGELRARNIQRDELLHVAQSLYHDHAPAQQLGIQSCLVDRRHEKAGWGAVPAPMKGITPDYCIRSLNELATLLEHAE